MWVCKILYSFDTVMFVGNEGFCGGVDDKLSADQICVCVCVCVLLVIESIGVVVGGGYWSFICK
jgi:hypothetical protein